MGSRLHLHSVLHFPAPHAGRHLASFLGTGRYSVPAMAVQYFFTVPESLHTDDMSLKLLDEHAHPFPEAA